MAERYVLLGLALPRARWFRDVAHWATSAAIPAEFHKCVSAGELRGQLDSGRAFSAVLLDGGMPALDRDLIANVRDAGTAPIVVDDGRDDADWATAGAVAVLPTGFGREQLLDVLADHAVLVRGPEAAAAPRQADDDGAVRARGVSAAVLGPGGTGVSTMAMALAQGLAGDPSQRWPRVLLADLRRRAEQGMLHDARDVFPGLEELVELHRGRPPGAVRVREHTFFVEQRGYDLLLGLRRPTNWPAVRAHAFELALGSMLDCWHASVLDCDPEVEGEVETGSPDIAERHQLTRTAVINASAVVVVGVPGMKGLASLVHLLADLARVGVGVMRMVPVINHAPRSPKARAQIASALGALAHTALPGAELANPVFVPHKRVEDALRDGVSLPATLADTLRGALAAAWARAPALPPPPEAGAEAADVTASPGMVAR